MPVLPACYISKSFSVPFVVSRTQTLRTEYERYSGHRYFSIFSSSKTPHTADRVFKDQVNLKQEKARTSMV